MSTFYEKMEEKLKEHRLSLREQQILLLWIQDYNYKQIASCLEVSPHTVRTVIKRIYVKMKADSKVTLIAMIMDK
ncbi:DNA-binding CsgD family transcriptional regulator [Paenibacillus endophyticus]|uniref:DNA-binding CsgD family transcriptional regulator n=1 Tax=Paenibacillus endophyticus TaxID=1294268 RepID=A0A7W5CB71_9BACL|nr:helix-turn-helix transcriptional regulator [Paenibacillus endophyticus]MBB3154065.1 DNA-binding CsgD family transcriptional regulator [Paenibacillus endophyticus]